MSLYEQGGGGQRSYKPQWRVSESLSLQIASPQRGDGKYDDSVVAMPQQHPSAVELFSSGGSVTVVVVSAIATGKTATEITTTMAPTNPLRQQFCHILLGWN